jgi:putative hemolysin
VSILVVTLLLAYVTLVFGELAPKRVAMQRAERWGLVAARPLALISTLARPAVWLLSRSTDIAVRLMGGDPTRDREEVTEEELREMVAGQTSFTPKQRLIIDGAFEISERTLEEVLRPRGEVFVLDGGQPGREALAALAASGHSRAPVGTQGNLDDVIGVVHLRDLLDLGDRPVASAASEIRAFPEGAGVLDALHEMQLSRSQLAIVVDEHGSVAGIVTMEDLIEELVGEIYDETDRDFLDVQRQPDGSLLMPGQFPVHDLPDLGLHGVPDGPYTTVAGLILDRLGRVPDAPGDRITIPGWDLEVRAMRRHAIAEVAAIPHAPETGEHDDVR